MNNLYVSTVEIWHGSTFEIYNENDRMYRFNIRACSITKDEKYPGPYLATSFILRREYFFNIFYTFSIRSIYNYSWRFCLIPNGVGVN